MNLLSDTLDIWEFGRQLILSQDLDPVYCAIWRAKLPRPQLYRLLFAYWCFYHLGVSAWLSEWEGRDFWSYMYMAANNQIRPCDCLQTTFERWPRGTERRHFRGDRCTAAIDWFREQYNDPEAPAKQLGHCQFANTVMIVVRGWPMFGSWVAFKVADMLERCADVRLAFPSDIGLMYREPREGLLMVPGAASDILKAWNQVQDHFRVYTAPPARDRPCGVQEVETILCKWKSHIKGHYLLGKDTHEVRHALVGWGSTADQLARGLC